VPFPSHSQIIHSNSYPFGGLNTHLHVDQYFFRFDHGLTHFGGTRDEPWCPRQSMRSFTPILYVFLCKVFGRPFIKRFTLSYRTVVCLSVLSVTMVYCGQTVGWIKMPRGAEAGLGPGGILLDGDPPRKGHSSPHFSAHIYCGQTARWIKMPLGKEVGLRPDDIVLDGEPAPPRKGHSSPHFLAHVYCGQTVAHLSYC